MIWANLLLYVSLAISFIFACTPREKIWQPNIDGRCVNAPVLFAAGSAINVISDVTILITPLVAISQLHLPLKTKLKAGAVFLVGVL